MCKSSGVLTSEVPDVIHNEYSAMNVPECSGVKNSYLCRIIFSPLIKCFSFKEQYMIIFCLEFEKKGVSTKSEMRNMNRNGNKNNNGK